MWPWSPAPGSSKSEANWATRIFRRSVLKQQKFAALVDMLGTTEGLSCLDIGGDNGVVSLLLRQLGGEWTSADLDDESVDAIRRLVGEPVYRINGAALPFDDQSFDVVVIIDFLEHIYPDVAVVAEFERVLRPGGTLVVNVPHIKPRSILRRLRPLLGISDARHGHVRPGYTRAGLRTVLGSRFRIEQEREYCGSFSESLDMVLNAALEQRTKGSARSAKGAVLTGSELAGLNKEYRLLSLAYPILKAWSALDVLLPFQSRYRLIVRARRPGLDLPSK